MILTQQTSEGPPIEKTRFQEEVAFQNWNKVRFDTADNMKSLSAVSSHYTPIPGFYLSEYFRLAFQTRNLSYHDTFFHYDPVSHGYLYEVYSGFAGEFYDVSPFAEKYLTFQKFSTTDSIHSDFCTLLLLWIQLYL